MPQLAPNGKCTGCSACKQVCPNHCIEMEYDGYGFQQAAVKHSNDCIHCDLCAKTCPVINKVPVNSYIKAYAAINKNENTRMRSSSGGIFYLLAEYIIKSDGIVFGAAYNSRMGIEHVGITDINKIEMLQGAKYAQSDLKSVFIEIRKSLSDDKYVLFSGTPCQVAALKLFLKKDYEKLICVDFICHGIPSPLIWEKYLEYLISKDEKRSKILDVNLREKSSGWSRYRYSTKFVFDSDEYSCENKENLFMKLFVRDAINRDSCEDCDFKGTERVSDFTLGDFWGVWDIHPELDDDRGTSAIILHTEKAAALWDDLNELIVEKEISIEDVIAQNPSLITSSKQHKNRDQIIPLTLKGGFDEAEKLLDPEITISKKQHFKEFVKSLLHMQ